MHDKLPPAIFLMGPTASGKTGLAVELVRHLPLEIISVDSALVYRGMDIGTAKPGPDILAKAPHRLIDIRDPLEAYSAAEFRTDALAAMAGISARGRVPLLVGGTFLYFRALEQGLSDMPAAAPEIRARLEAEARRDGLECLHARLARVDPVAAARIHVTDPQRILRALEVYEQTGEPLSVFHARGRNAAFPYRLLKLALLPQDRGMLHDRIAARFSAMLAAGLVEEVRRLYLRGDLTPELPAMRAVGYRQVWAHLAGEISYEELPVRAIVATRQYARRQLTWLRGEANIEHYPADDDRVADRLAERISDWLGSKK
ncbi:MAG: tRNA (adenosine(37)-N6)-dimethylallyltransferase MiaA [Gammaproteobacteria bacterium]|jgi:tRNA dimethylallyltransferase